jgi:hypothetical protein
MLPATGWIGLTLEKTMIGILTRTATWICTIALLAAPTSLVGCGTDKGGGDGTSINCPAGQSYNGTTNKCVDNAGDGFVSSGDSSSSSSSGGSSSGSGADADSGLPWQIDDGGGLKKDTSAAYDPWWDCPPEKLHPTGALHGKKCDKNADCLYGRCVVGSPLAAYDSTIKFCTKNNGCGTGNLVSCNTENGNGHIFYSVFERSVSGGNPKRDPKKDVHKFCAKNCKSNTDCVKWNPELPHCMKTTNKFISFGTNAVCGVDPDQ